MDEAFPMPIFRHAAIFIQRNKASFGIAPDPDHRMQHHSHFKPLGRQQCQRRINQKRHVIIDDVDDRQTLCHIHAKLRAAGKALGKLVKGPACHRRQISARSPLQIFSLCIAEQMAGKSSQLRRIAFSKAHGLRDGGVGKRGLKHHISHALGIICPL